MVSLFFRGGSYFFYTGWLLLGLLAPATASSAPSDSLSGPVLHDPPKKKETRLASAALPVHPFGIFFLRIADDFSRAPSAKSRLSVAVSSANVWAPPVKVYRPLDPAIVSAMRNTPWHVRTFTLDKEATDHERYEFSADGVLKEFKMDYTFRFRQQHEFTLSTRAYSLRRGTGPFNLLVSDSFIEWFHSNIAGGEDPFARKVWGFDQGGIYYKDESGNSMAVAAGDFFWGASELHYTYYPRLFRNPTYSLNASAHLSASHQQHSPSMDGGLSFTFLKRIRVGAGKDLSVGINPGFVKHRLLRYGTGVGFMDTNHSATFQGLLNYTYSSPSQALLWVSLGFYAQSPYATGDKNDDFLVFEGERYSSHWHLSASHLYEVQETWTLSFGYEKRYAVSVYLQEDFKVNNAPDLQTGIQLGFPI